MPNIVGVTELNGATNLITVQLGTGALVSVTRAEAQAWIDSHPGSTDAQIEAQVVSLIQSRWTNRTDTVAVHLLSRSPLACTIWIGVGTAAGAWWS